MDTQKLEKTLEQRVRELEERLNHQALSIEKLDRLVYKLFGRIKRPGQPGSDEPETA